MYSFSDLLSWLLSLPWRCKNHFFHCLSFEATASWQWCFMISVWNIRMGLKRDPTAQYLTVVISKLEHFKAVSALEKKKKKKKVMMFFSLDSHFKRRLNLEVKSCLSSEWCRGKSPIRLICHSPFRNSSTMLGWFSSWCSQKLKDWFSVFYRVVSHVIVSKHPAWLCRHAALPVSDVWFVFPWG